MTNRMMVIILLLLLCASLSFAQQKTTISVMDLNVTSGLAANEVVLLTDKLLNEFVIINVFDVVERSKRDEILKEQGFQQTGACDQGKCLVEAGQLLGVQKMVGGTVGRFGTVYAVELRIMDIKTGKIDLAFSRKYNDDVAGLLDAMKEAAIYFSGGKVEKASNQKTLKKEVQGIVFMKTNRQGAKEYSNLKDSSYLIEIPAGSFTMGSNGNDNEKPSHIVYLDSYYIGKYEITVSQFRKFCKATDKAMPEQPSWNNHDDYPVVKVTWNDATAYCDWAGLRLPTEAEWEKAARATDGRTYPWGNSWEARKCNSFENEDRYKNTAPVGSFPSGCSPYGCYDMAGNVWEWCNDWYSENYYISPSNSNPVGPALGIERVVRGGGWQYRAPLCRSAARRGDNPDSIHLNRGFRVAK